MQRRCRRRFSPLPPYNGTTVRGTVENGSNSDQVGLSFVGGFFITFQVISIHVYELKFLSHRVCTKLRQVLTQSYVTSSDVLRMFFGSSAELTWTTS